MNVCKLNDNRMDENVIAYLSGPTDAEKLDSWSSIRELVELRDIAKASSSTMENQACWGAMPVTDGGEIHHETL